MIIEMFILIAVVLVLFVCVFTLALKCDSLGRSIDRLELDLGNLENFRVDDNTRGLKALVAHLGLEFIEHKSKEAYLAVEKTSKKK